MFLRFIVSQLMLDLGKTHQDPGSRCPSGGPRSITGFSLDLAVCRCRDRLQASTFWPVARWSKSTGQRRWSGDLQWGNAMIPPVRARHRLGWIFRARPRLLLARERKESIFAPRTSLSCSWSAWLSCSIIRVFAYGTYQEYHQQPPSHGGVWQNAHNFSIACSLSCSTLRHVHLLGCENEKGHCRGRQIDPQGKSRGGAGALVCLSEFFLYRLTTVDSGDA